MAHTKRDGLRLKFLSRIPMAFLVNPPGMFLATLCLLSGVPLLIGNIQPASIEATLPGLLPRIWGLSLAAGAVFTVVGAFMAHRRSVVSSTVQYQRGQGIERIGLLILGYASAIYAFSIISFVGGPGVQAGAITLAFALCCWLQAFLIRAQFTLVADLNRDFGINEDHDDNFSDIGTNGGNG